MNNSIVIKNADFSGVKVDKLNITKLTVTNDGIGYADAVNNDLQIITSTGGWDPSQEAVHSAQITLPANTVALFGKSNKILSSDTFNSWLANPSPSWLPGTALPDFVYHRSDTDTWHRVIYVYYDGVENRPNIIKYKQGIYLNQGFTIAAYDGPIHGTKFQYPIDKIVINWIKKDAPQGHECGLVLPEVYAYSE